MNHLRHGYRVAMGAIVLAGGLMLPLPKPAQAYESPSLSGQTEAVKPVELQVGMPAPDFTLTDQFEKTHHLADLRGKTVVLAFYPADMTPG